MKKIYGIVHDAIRKGIESEGKVVLNQDGISIDSSFGNR